MLRFNDILSLPFPEAHSRLTQKDVWLTCRPKEKTNFEVHWSCSPDSVRAGLTVDGYHAMKPQWPSDMSDMASRVVELDGLGYPASFLLMYESTWNVAQAASEIVRTTVSERLACNMVHISRQMFFVCALTCFIVIGYSCLAD